MDFLIAKVKSVVDNVKAFRIVSATGRDEDSEEIETRALMQQRGFSSIPKEGDKVLILRSGNLKVAVASDSTDRPELKAGESAIYNDKKNYIKMRADGSVQIVTEGKISIGSSEDVNSSPLAGVVTGENLDPVTGVPFPDKSAVVFAQKLPGA